MGVARMKCVWLILAAAAALPRLHAQDELDSPGDSMSLARDRLPPRWCGGAPEATLPWSGDAALHLANFSLEVVSAEDLQTSARVMASVSGPKPKETSALYGCSRTRAKIQHENAGAGMQVRPTELADMTAAQRQFHKCLRDINECNAEAATAAAHLSSVQTLVRQAPAKLGSLHKFRTCAIVGNAGHLRLKQYGQYIDKHDVVVRFNAQTMTKFGANVGSKTTLRVLNHARSRDACCPNGKQLIPDKGAINRGKTAFLLWHPGGQKELVGACRKTYPKAEVQALNRNFVMSEVAVMQALRRDAARFGLTRMGAWRQLTSGGHAILMMARMCEHISLYGITTYPNPAAAALPDQYGGRGKKSRSGRNWHDWGGESAAWRILHAANKLSICSM